MSKKMYYTVKHELTRINGVLETTGFKNISMYSIENDKLIKVGDIDAENDTNEIEKIENYLIDNGCVDETFDFILV